MATLKTKVTAVNRAHQEANIIFPLLRDLFLPLIGKKVIKADGSLLKSVRERVLEVLPELSSAMFKTSRYNLAWETKACVNEDGHAHYHSATVYVADLEGDTVSRVYDSFSARADYTVEEVMALRATYFQAKKAADNAKSALGPFGEYDV